MASTTSFHKAIISGDVDSVRSYLDTGSDVNEEHPAGRGRTPLWLASWKGHLQIVKLLLDHGADVNLPLSSGFTAFMIACQEGHVGVVRLLLEKGTDVTRRTIEDELTALHLACKSGHLDIIRVLLDTGQCDVNTKDSERRTPLHSTVLSGSLAAVQLMVDAGASMSPENTTEMTPLHLACLHDNLEIVEHLISRGHTVNIGEGAEQGTPLTLAARGTNGKLVQLLLDSGASVNSLDVFGCSMLYNVKSVAIAKLLLSAGCDVNMLCRGKHLVEHAVLRNLTDLALLYYNGGSDVKLIKTSLNVIDNKCPELATLIKEHQNTEA